MKCYDTVMNIIAGRALPYNASLYTGSPKGIVYLQCNESNCLSLRQGDHSCYRGGHDLVVQCYSPSKYTAMIIHFSLIAELTA